MKTHIKCYPVNCKHSFHATLYCHILPYRSMEAPLGMLLLDSGVHLWFLAQEEIPDSIYTCPILDLVSSTFQKKKSLIPLATKPRSDSYIFNSFVVLVCSQHPWCVPTKGQYHLPSYDNQKYLQTLSNIPWRAKSSQLRTNGLHDGITIWILYEPRFVPLIISWRSLQISTEIILLVF